MKLFDFYNAAKTTIETPRRRADGECARRNSMQELFPSALPAISIQKEKEKERDLISEAPFVTTFFTWNTSLIF
jgi:hypothetical protein